MIIIIYPMQCVEVITRLCWEVIILKSDFLNLSTSSLDYVWSILWQESFHLLTSSLAQHLKTQKYKNLLIKSKANTAHP